MSLFSWLFGAGGDAPGKPPVAPATPASASPSPPASSGDPLGSVRSSAGDAPKKLDLYDPLVLERISQAAKELQKSGEVKWCIFLNDD